MPRVKRGTIHVKRRKNILRQTRGFFHRRKSHLREARQALIKAGQYALRDRRKKKTVFRSLWHIQIGAATRAAGLSYSKFISLLKAKDITVNRKMLATIAQHHPEVFARILDAARK